MYSMVPIISDIVYLKAAKRVDLKNSHHKKKTFVTMRIGGC